MKSACMLVLFLVGCWPAMAQLPDCQAIPGWKQDGEPRSYQAENLFEYMNGNAEGYLIYRFVEMKGISCKCGEDTVVIDISQMEDPEDAFGIFQASRDQRQGVEKIGMGGQVLPRRAVFAKDKYYVELAANPDKDHSASLRKFAALIEKQISGQNQPPEAVGWFPLEGLAGDSIRLKPESVLGLRALKRGYIAQYSFGKGFLVGESSPEEARQVFAKLKERIGQVTPVQAGEEAFAGQDKYLDGLVVFRKGRFVGGFANLKDGYDASPAAVRFAAALK